MSIATTLDRPFLRLQVRGRRCVPVGNQPAHVSASLDAVPVAIHCRTSNQNQRIGSQYDECRRYCDRLGYAVVREYLEEGHSGDSPHFGPSAPIYSNVFQRPLLRELILESLLTHPFERIICWADDRWSRLPAREDERLLDALKGPDIQLEYVVHDRVLDLVERDDHAQEAGRDKQ